MDSTAIFIDPLVDAAKTGDARALTQLWTTWKPVADRSAAKYLKDREDLDQAACQGLTKAILNLDKWKGTGPFAAWLSQVVRNETVNWIRTNKDKVKNFSEITDFDAATEEVRSDRAALAIILGLIDKLPDRQQLAFKLVILEDLTYEKAAIHMKTTPGAVKSNVHDARVKLRKLLSGTGLR